MFNRFTAFAAFCCLFVFLQGCSAANPQPDPDPDPGPQAPTAAFSADVTETFLLPGNVPLTMVGIPAGTFMMGATTRSDEQPVHQVTLSENFQMGQTEVTKAQWAAVMGTTPWSGQSYVLNDPDSPAVYVSWNDAQAFITALNSLTGETFRLPTEAEWEYACRAGSTTEYYFGDSSANLSDYAWYGLWGTAEDYAHVVAQLLPNAFGLYDMHGNVWEWCNDWYSSSYYSSSPSVDPMGPASGSVRVLRGGSWGTDAGDCRSADRGGNGPTSTSSHFGFRLAR